MKRTLLVFTALVSVGVPALTPLTAAAQDEAARVTEQSLRRPDEPHARGGRTGRSAESSTPQQRPQQDRPASDRPNRGDRDDRGDRPNRPDRPAGGWNGGERPDRDRDEQSRPNRPSGGWNDGRPGDGRPNRPDRDRGDRGDRPNRPNGDWNDHRRDRQEWRNRWNRDQWRNDWGRRHDRHDWWRNDNRFRGWSGVRIGFYFAPGYGYYRVPRSYWGRRFYEGDFLPSLFWRYEIRDYAAWGLPWPPAGTMWVMVDNTIYLVDRFDGRVLDVLYDAWRW